MNIQKEEGYSITYLVQAFNQFYLKYSHIVESIYPSNDFTLFSTNLTGEYQGKLSTSFEVDSSEKLFVNVIAFITKDNFEDRILYSHVLVENEPAPEPEPEPEPPSRTYILSKVFQSFTQNANEEKLFVLDKKVEDEIVFKIELMIEENKLSDKQYLDFTIEPKQDFPVYANSSEVKLINYTTEYEKKIFIFSSTKSLMINFFIENSSNDEKNITYDVKYKTYQSEEKIKTIIPSDYSATVNNNSMTLVFKELFDSSEELSIIYYKLYYYLKETDITKIDKIISLEEPLSIQALDCYNNGSEYKLKYEVPSQAKDYFYVTLNAYYVLKDTEEQYVYYGLKNVTIPKQEEPKEGIKWWLILILVIIGVVVVVGILFIIMRMRKKNHLQVEDIGKQDNDLNVSLKDTNIL